MASEGWVLGGIALTGANFEILELTADPPKARFDWISSADSEGAALMRQPQHENRTITMKLRVAAQASMDAAFDQVGLILDKLRLASATADGVTLVWTPANSARSRTFTVLAGEIPELPIGLSDHAYSWFLRRPVFTVEMTCEPYWVASEVLTSTASSGTTPYASLEVASVPGDIPALGRLIVTDTATQSRRHLEWGLENLYYNSGLSLTVESDSMSVSGLAGAQTTRTGAYDPGAVGNNVVRASLAPTPVGVVSTGNLSHVGTYRVKARVYATSTSVGVRLAYKSGDSEYTTNLYDYPPIANAFTEVDLGIITIAPALAGTQRWVGRIDAFSTGSGDTIDIDYLVLVPAGEGYGKARGPTVLETVTAFSAHDEFDQAAGVLTGKVAPQGGTWAGAGDADDFSVHASHFAFRTGVSDADALTGRYMILGTATFTDVLVQGDFVTDPISAFPGTSVWRTGVLARYTDVNNWLWAGWETTFASPTSSAAIKLIKRVAGTATTIATYPVSVASTTVLTGHTFRLVVDSSGNATVFWGGNAFIGANGTDRAPQRVILATDTALATGGTLATGKVGFYEAYTAGLAWTRYADNFFAAVPSPTSVIYSGRSAQVRFDDTIRFDSTGTYYGRPPVYRGTRFLVPTGTSRVIAKARRQDLDTASDDVVGDATQIQVGYQPRGIAVPR